MLARARRSPTIASIKWGRASSPTSRSDPSSGAALLWPLTRLYYLRWLTRLPRESVPGAEHQALGPKARLRAQRVLERAARRIAAEGSQPQQPGS